MSDEKNEKKNDDGKDIEKKETELEAATQPVADPFAQMIQFYDTFSKSWSNVMSDAVASKGFAEAMGQQIESGMDAMTLWRRQMGDIFEQYLQQMSLPTRSQVIGLAERMTNLEIALDDLNAKVDELLDQMKSSSS